MRFGARRQVEQHRSAEGSLAVPAGARVAHSREGHIDDHDDAFVSRREFVQASATAVLAAQTTLAAAPKPSAGAASVRDDGVAEGLSWLMEPRARAGAG